ncbi:GntR family transcriptional regulator [Pseudonocardia humida]|uniref:GntR family transcriptional regulator n=1 Tax=Pseudonocardia humida TaxID=2800819 RepID=A0ABT0ZXK3_9PSEU|nr:GntR family transcriptional regulator [Pseudonocardia humida]MCO1655468.1 GntR family transcriptional regulator [Pseudonocardia humida]
MSTSLGARTSLARRLAEDVRSRIMSGEYAPGERLPSEAELVRHYEVSRVTVRTALRTLEAQGLVDVRHGSGSFVSDFGAGIRAGLQELRSISDTIREMGHEPRMERHARQRRPATPGEAAKLGIAAGEDVLAVERMILADERAVAYSYDVVPLAGFPDELVEQLGAGSLFGTLDAAGLMPARALAEVHAISDETIGWGPQKPVPGLYVLLDQVHFSRRGSAVAHSRTYFVEGRFQFVVLRTN